MLAQKIDPYCLSVYHKTGTTITVTHPNTCESFSLGNFVCLSSEKVRSIRRETLNWKKFKSVVWLGGFAYCEECSSPIPSFQSLFRILSYKMQEVSGGQIFPPTLHARTCVHKLCVLIQAFMQPSLITKLYPFSSLSGLQNSKCSFT